MIVTRNTLVAWQRLERWQAEWRVNERGHMHFRHSCARSRWMHAYFCHGAGNNIPVDLFLEHLNRTLKVFVSSTGANVSPSTITQTSKSLKFLLNISDHFDEICNVNPISLHHTKASSKEDRDKILKQLASESRVFDYVPGRYHKTFKGIHPHISSHLDINKLVTWIKQTRNSIANRHELKKLFQREK